MAQRCVNIVGWAYFAQQKLIPLWLAHFSACGYLVRLTIAYAVVR